MGTRADFYIEVDKKLEWIGSTTHDGYQIEEWEDYAPIRDAKSLDAFKEAFAPYIEDQEDRWRPVEEGWPWPWEDSHITDYVYIFKGDHLAIYKYDELDALDLPNMAHLKKSNKGAGFMGLQSMS